MAANEVFTKLFFAMQRVKAPMLSSVIAISINIPLVSILVKTVGLNGVAIASSVTIAACALINYLLISSGGALFKVRDFFDIVKALLSSAIMGACVYFAKGAVSFSNDLLLSAILGCVGVLAYAVCVLILSPTEIRSIIKRGK